MVLNWLSLLFLQKALSVKKGTLKRNNFFHFFVFFQNG